MRLMMDSHVLIWYVDQDHLLTPDAHAAITDPANDMLVSAATLWELAIKAGQKKLSLSLPYRQWMNQAIADLELTVLPVTVEYADRQSSLPTHHKDPFDRLIIAQALVENVPVICADPVFDAYGVTRVW
jgi:PIN domain nuclease of toxin-antitoxin system